MAKGNIKDLGVSPDETSVEQEKEKLVEYKVNSNLLHDKKLFQCGDLVCLPDIQAAPLLGLKIIERI